MPTKLPVRYWCASPEYAKEFLQKYLQRVQSNNILMLDPFAGIGMFAKEALILGRKLGKTVRVVCVDVNPFACLVARVLLSKVNKSKVLEVWHRIKLRVISLIEELYTQYCPFCHRHVRVRYYIWQNGYCQAVLVCGHRVQSQDINENVEGIPDGTFRYPNGNVFRTKGAFEYIRDMYTRRNAKILVALQREIKSLSISDSSAGPIKELLQVAFAYATIRCSKMERPRSGVFPVPCYWQPDPFVERDPVEVMEYYVKKLANYCSRHKFNLGSLEDVLNGDADVCIICEDARKVAELLPENSVDVVCTDPPFFDEVQFLELTYVMNKWLGLDTPFDREIVVNRARELTDECYFNAMSKVAESLHKVIKNKGQICLIIHEEDRQRISRLREIFEKYFKQISVDFRPFRKFKRIGNVSDKPQIINLLLFEKE